MRTILRLRGVLWCKRHRYYVSLEQVEIEPSIRFMWVSPEGFQWRETAFVRGWLHCRFRWKERSDESIDRECDGD
ncbi:hypothetical protein L2E82_35384 [Cichorium intybus]|uniref:Uncharacterized protein n=1 Tax=Cichorium intybus TaxID=13427 RepID=A0ACB9BNM2_CICIN|nr:hypothetical protein L2E82_35384 [Cichorium intybus]